MEDKQAICDALAATLKLTRNQNDIAWIDYIKDDRSCLEIAVIAYENGTKKIVNVTADSGIAMIRDIMKVID